MSALQACTHTHTHKRTAGRQLFTEIADVERAGWLARTVRHRQRDATPRQHCWRHCVCARHQRYSMHRQPPLHAPYMQAQQQHARQSWWLSPWRAEMCVCAWCDCSPAALCACSLPCRQPRRASCRARTIAASAILRQHARLALHLPRWTRMAAKSTRTFPSTFPKLHVRLVFCLLAARTQHIDGDCGTAQGTLTRANPRCGISVTFTTLVRPTRAARPSGMHAAPVHL